MGACSRPRDGTRMVEPSAITPSSHPVPLWLQESRAKALAEIDQDACRRNGGHIGGVGMFGMPTCLIPNADGGKACTDSSQCLGKLCLQTDDSPLWTPDSTGKCILDESQTYGC